jgi:asparagine synthase (glutamine-hydrolysing)
LISSGHFDEALNKVLIQYDDPFGDASAIPTGNISKYAAEYVKMVLTGDGGDEVLA